MISLKKYIESDREALLKTAVMCYRSAIRAMGDNVMQACRPVGAALHQTLVGLQSALAAELTPQLLQETEQRVEKELQQWGTNASRYLQQQTKAIRDVLLILTHTAQTVSTDSEHHAGKISQLVGRLESIAHMDDIAEVRDRLTQSAYELKDCVDHMVRSSQESVARLRQDVNRYQAQLESAERLATTDPLTGVGNRLSVESAITFRLAQERDFSLILFDINDFKQINDTYGHLAGDELLKQFACELRATFRTIDVIGRWGGDEFLVVLDCDAQEARNHVDRVRKWVYGDYTIPINDRPAKISIDAAAGVASWQPGDTIDALLSRADRSMYSDKRASRFAEVRW
ncbi:MAG TPA: GGDEF domain-containing protein [Bryobacteraceae bacterium]|nr:GGDEF domain-containing protein [Bryobacteraceae bacterium]